MFQFCVRVNGRHFEFYFSFVLSTYNSDTSQNYQKSETLYNEMAPINIKSYFAVSRITSILPEGAVQFVSNFLNLI